MPELLAQMDFEQVGGVDPKVGLLFSRDEGHGDRQLMARQLDNGEWRFSELSGDHKYGARGAGGDPVQLLRHYGQAGNEAEAMAQLRGEIRMMDPESIRQGLACHDDARRHDHTNARQQFAMSAPGSVSGHLKDQGINAKTLAWAGDVVRAAGNGAVISRLTDEHGRTTGYQTQTSKGVELAAGSQPGLCQFGNAADPAKIVIMPNAMDALALAQLGDLPSDTLFVSPADSMDPQKVADAVAALTNDFPEAELAVIGNDDLGQELAASGVEATMEASPEGGWGHVVEQFEATSDDRVTVIAEGMDTGWMQHVDLSDHDVLIDCDQGSTSEIDQARAAIGAKTGEVDLDDAQVSEMLDSGEAGVYRLSDYQAKQEQAAQAAKANEQSMRQR
jgi:hypothetical protein